MSRISSSADLRNQIPSTQLIASVIPSVSLTLNSATSSVNLNNFPAGNSFVVNVNTRLTASDAKANVFMRFNDITGTVYDQVASHGVDDTEATVAAYNQSSFSLSFFPANGAPTYHSGNATIQLPNAKNTTFFKNFTAVGNHVTTGSEARVGITQGICRSTGALSSIQFFLSEGNFATGSYFAIAPAP